MKSDQQIIFPMDDIAEPGARSFSLTGPQGEIQGFVIRFAGEIRAYINSCPHARVTLNWANEKFFDYDYNFVQCSMHGALFDPLSGYCIWGPCVGESLSALPVKVVDKKIIIYS